MSGTLYSLAVLRLAAQSGHWPLLGTPATRSEKRSAVCGSAIIVDLRLGAGGTIAAIGAAARACALGQAATTLLARCATGRTPADLEQVAREWRAWLAGERDSVPPWPGLETLGEVRAFPARHGAVLLPFDAAAQAAMMAMAHSPADNGHDGSAWSPPSGRCA